MAQFPAYYRLNAPCNAPSHTFNNPDNQHTPTPTQTQKALTDKIFTTRRSADSWKLCRRRFLSASFVNGALTLQQTKKNSKSIHHFPPQIHNAFMLGRFFFFFFSLHFQANAMLEYHALFLYDQLRCRSGFLSSSQHRPSALKHSSAENEANLAQTRMQTERRNNCNLSAKQRY